MRGKVVFSIKLFGIEVLTVDLCRIVILDDDEEEDDDKPLRLGFA